jgi:leader peptidase (prepilin peptidase)/N-methyltransferase
VGLYAAVLLGGILGVVLALLKVIDRRNNPFGPYMLVGALVGAVWGQRIWAGLYGG